MEVSFLKSKYESNGSIIQEWVKSLQHVIDPGFHEYFHLYGKELDFYELLLSQEKIGYFGINPEESSVNSFFILEKYRLMVDPKDVFKTLIIDQLKITEANVDTLDTFFLNLVLDFQIKSITVKRYSAFTCYRKSIEEFSHPLNFKELVLAEESDFSRVWETIKEDRQYFLGKESTKREILGKGIFLLFKHEDEKNEKIIGVGVIIKSENFLDSWGIGMLVAKEFRRKGIGTYILNVLQNMCIENQKIPTAGCDSPNIGSRKTLQKSGMVNLGSDVKIKFT